MDSGYIPEVGDVVDYKGKRMVILGTKKVTRMGDCIYYLLDECLVKEGYSDETETFRSKCTKVNYITHIPNTPHIPFTKVGTLPIEIHNVSYTKIHLKE